MPYSCALRLRRPCACRPSKGPAVMRRFCTIPGISGRVDRETPSGKIAATCATVQPQADPSRPLTSEQKLCLLWPALPDRKQLEFVDRSYALTKVGLFSRKILYLSRLLALTPKQAPKTGGSLTVSGPTTIGQAGEKRSFGASLAFEIAASLHYITVRYITV